LIMKVDKTPATLLPQDIDRDFDFWTWYCEKLLETYLPPGERTYVFQRDLVARKTFSKLRGAIAGLYYEKGLPDRAEAAYLQSMELYPASPEAVFRLADMYNRQLRFDDSEHVVERFAGFDPTNQQIPVFYQGLRQLRSLNESRLKAEASMAKRPSANTALQLLQYYGHLQMDKEMKAMADLLLRMSNLHPDFYKHMAAFMRIKKNKEYYLKATEAWAKGSDKDPEAYYDLAAYHLSQNAYQETFNAMVEAVRRAPLDARRQLAVDPRFNELHIWPQFQKLVEIKETESSLLAPRSSQAAPRATSRGFNLPLGQ
jgi:tetratricopeptide (TPR) repeat protein